MTTNYFNSNFIRSRGRLKLWCRFLLFHMLCVWAQEGGFQDSKERVGLASCTRDGLATVWDWSASTATTSSKEQSHTGWYLSCIVYKAVYISSAVYKPNEGITNVCIFLVFATVPNSRINSWETWFIFNLRKNELSVIQTTYCILSLSFSFPMNHGCYNFYIHLYILERLSLAAPREYVHPSFVLALDWVLSLLAFILCPPCLSWPT
jgi:hypothetical protein